MAKKVTCPDCGAEVDSRGLASHQKGAKCLVASALKLAQERGHVPAYPHHQLLRDAGVPVWEYATRYVPGGPGRTVKVIYSPYVEAWARQVAELPLPAKERKRLLSLGPDSPDVSFVLLMSGVDACKEGTSPEM